MNWEYIITPWQVYYTERKAWERFKIDNQNKVKYTHWDVIEDFSHLDIVQWIEKKVSDAFYELWELETEKGNLIIFNNKNWDNIYIYNSIEKMDKFDNEFIYANILFEKRQDQIVKKTEDFCNFVLSENIKSISNAAKLETLRNKEEFLLSMSNEEFIREELVKIDDRLAEDIFLLWKWCHMWYYWKVYLYAFIESWWKLIPIYFNYDSLSQYDVSQDLSYDKIEIIMTMEWKEKVSLFFTKIMESIMIFKKDVIKENELQIFYNKLFEKNKSIIKNNKNIDLSDFDNIEL